MRVVGIFCFHPVYNDMQSSTVKRGPLIERLWIELTEKLDEVKKEQNYLHQVQQGLQVTQNSYTELKRQASNHSFKTAQEEIDFFKNVKPAFLKHLLFYIDVYRIQIQKPAGSPSDQKLYYEHELGKIKEYFDENFDKGFEVGQGGGQDQRIL